MRSGELRDRITLQRITGAGDGAFADSTTLPAKVWAAVEPLGDERYRVRIRYREDLKNRRDCEPAVRVLYDDQILEVEDVIEAERRVEVHLFCRDVVVPVSRLKTGGRRVKAWSG